MSTSTEQTRRAANGFTFLAFAGVWVAFMYVLLGSALCELPKEHDTKKQNQYTECIAKGHLTEYSCLEFLNPSPNKEPSDKAAGGEQYKFGSWTKNLFCETKASDIVIALLTYGLVLVGGFQAFWLKKTVDTAADVAGKQAIDMQASIDAIRDSAKAAARSADVAERALAMTDRPWLEIEIYITGDLTFGPEDIKIPIRGTFKNIGKSPATNVGVIFEMHPDIVSASINADKAATQIANMPWVSFMETGLVLFPDKDGVTNKIASIKRAVFIECLAERNKDPKHAPFKGLNPAICGFAYYRLPAGGRTRFRCTTVLLEINSALMPDGFDGSEIIVAKDNLELVQTIFSGTTT